MEKGWLLGLQGNRLLALERLSPSLAQILNPVQAQILNPVLTQKWPGPFPL